MERIDWRMRFGPQNVSITSLKLSPLALDAKGIIFIDRSCNLCQTNAMQMNLREKAIDLSNNSREVRQKWFWLSSNCNVILVWKLTLVSRKSWTKYWRFVLKMIFLSKFISTLRESHNDHNSRTTSVRNTHDLLQPQGLSATIQIQVHSEDKQIKQNLRCKFTLICQIQRMYS